MLLTIGTSTGQANAFSATIAVTFVFFASTSKVFKSKDSFLIQKFICYLVYQVISISAASWGISALSAAAVVDPIIAKVIVTPITFYLNFQFMSLLVTGRLRLR